MVLRVLLEDVLGNCPHFLVDPASRRLERQDEDDWTREQLWLVIVEYLVGPLDESSVISHGENVFWQPLEIQKLLVFVTGSHMIVENISLGENFIWGSLGLFLSLAAILRNNVVKFIVCQPL